MSCLVTFHYRSYGTFFLQQNRLHNIHRGFTHYKYYRAGFVSLFCFYLENDDKYLPSTEYLRYTSIILNENQRAN